MTYREFLQSGRIYRLRACLVLVFFLVTPLAAQEEIPVIDAEYQDAVAIVNELHTKLMYIMQYADSLGYQGRFDEVKGIVTQHFDTPLIARVIMSRYWRDLDATQQKDFIDLFRKLSIATYASRFDGYSGEKFVELSAEQLKKGRLLVKTELQRPDDKPVKLDYLMHRVDDGWMIISVIANGVNDLSLKRAEYATVIKEKGFPGLVEDVASKITDMENKDVEGE